MGLDLSFTVTNDRLDVRLSEVDWEILAILGKRLPDEMEALAGVDDFGVPREESRLALLQAVETVLERWEKEADNLPYVYGHAVVDGPYAGIGGSGMMSGLQIGGDGFYYSIEGELGKCVLIKQGRRPDGWGFDAEVRDIRDVETIQTDNIGTIKIYKKKKRTRLKDVLLQLKEFLSRNSDETVTKVLG